MISGELFQSLSQISFCTEKNCIINDQLKHMPQNVHIINEFPVENIKQYQKIFIYSHDIHAFFSKFLDHLSSNTTIITHNSDIGVDESCLKYLESPNINKWFCQNRHITHQKLFSLPIGIANGQWLHGNMQALKRVIDTKPLKNNLIYKSFDIGTNINKRNYVNLITNNNGIYMNPNFEFPRYIEELSKYLFAISPPGNGVDCHRIWECLSLNVITIVEDNECFSQFKHLPIMFINNWQDVTVPMLKDKIPQYIGKKFDLSVLDINYWRKII